MLFMRTSDTMQRPVIRARAADPPPRERKGYGIRGTDAGATGQPERIGAERAQRCRRRADGSGEPAPQSTFTV
jgi:hypothetical protein